MAKALSLFDLTGRVALVTGGSRGLGLQLAHALGEAGARLMIVSRKDAELKAAQDLLGSEGFDVRSVTADISLAAEPERVVSAAMEHFGRIDILVNNAGATWGAPAEHHPLEAWDKVMNLNTRAMFLMCQQAANQSMIPHGYGRIINLSSILGLAGSRSDRPSIAYNTSKAAVINFTRSLACEWGRFGINVNAIGPGIFPTRMANHAIETEGMDAITRNSPLGRIGGDNDLAGAALLFASEAGKHITGQFLAVDGGVTALSPI
jgi:NAD(P)-dependent dehydrogenase (short-subunit alcohol dehydrogenase family)